MYCIAVPVSGGARHHTRGAQESAHRLRKRKYIPRVHVREARGRSHQALVSEMALW